MKALLNIPQADAPRGREEVVVGQAVIKRHHDRQNHEHDQEDDGWGDEEETGEPATLSKSQATVWCGFGGGAGGHEDSLIRLSIGFRVRSSFAGRR